MTSTSTFIRIQPLSVLTAVRQPSTSTKDRSLISLSCTLREEGSVGETGFSRLYRIATRDLSPTLGRAKNTPKLKILSLTPTSHPTQTKTPSITGTGSLCPTVTGPFTKDPEKSPWHSKIDLYISGVPTTPLPQSSMWADISTHQKLVK